MNELMMIHIAVVLVVKNQRRYIDQSISSVVSQLKSGDKLIVVDDGSTDGTEIVCQQFLGNEYVEYIGFANSKGLTYRLIEAIERLPENTFILRQDGDDLSLPGRIHRFRSFFGCLPEGTLIASEVDFVDEEGFKKGVSKCSRARENNFDMRFGNFLVHGSVGFLKKDYDAIGGYDPRLRYAQDFALWSKWIEKFGTDSVILIDKPYYALRLHSTSISKKKRLPQLLTGVAIICQIPCQVRDWDDVATRLKFYAEIHRIVRNSNASVDAKVDVGVYLFKNGQILESLIMFCFGIRSLTRLVKGMRHLLRLRFIL